MTHNGKRIETLMAFSRSLDAHAGTSVGFVDAVVELAAVRARKAVIDARRKQIFEVVRVKFERGDLVAGEGRMLAQTEPTPVVTTRAVPADVVKKRSLVLWESARVAKPFVQVKPPKLLASSMANEAVQAVGALPPVPDARRAVHDVVALYEAVPPTTELRAREKSLVERLRLIGATYGWDGLPLEFSDKWTVGLDRLEFSSDRLREIDPRLWDALAVEKPTGGFQRVYVHKAEGIELDDDGE